MWTLYLLLCDQKIIYTGITNDLNHRIKQHLSKNSTYTKQFSDLKLIHSENYNTKSEAAKREKETKGWSRNKKISLSFDKLRIGTSSPHSVG
ncbi:GIY-YIG nuclease family protein [Candidatus Shapirobacteria bacterium]|nr:GIY-YIG nuclease family protein [Candidatus Shapirobacteria bacterium]